MTPYEVQRYTRYVGTPREDTRMLERHHVEDWLNRACWTNDSTFHEIVESIMSSGSDDEDEWLVIMENIIERENWPFA